MNNVGDKNLENILPEEKARYVFERFKIYHNAQENLTQKIADMRSEIMHDYKENVRNVAITAGAVAAFAIVLMDNFYRPTLIAGISILLMNMAYTYAYLMSLDTKNSKILLNTKRTALPPIQNMTKICIDFFQGRVSFNQFIIKEAELKRYGGVYNQTIEKIDELDKDKDQLDYKGDIILVIFIMALALIVFSLLYPSLFPFLSDIFSKMIYL